MSKPLFSARITYTRSGSDEMQHFNTRARNWYKRKEDFVQVCADAVSQARTETQQEFANKMMEKANELGLDTPISPKQMKWLAELGDHVQPPQIS